MGGLALTCQGDVDLRLAQGCRRWGASVAMGKSKDRFAIHQPALVALARCLGARASDPDLATTGVVAVLAFAAFSPSLSGGVPQANPIKAASPLTSGDADGRWL